MKNNSKRRTKKEIDDLLKNGLKWCCDCHKTLSVDSFYKSQRICKECVKQRNLKYKDRRKDYVISYRKKNASKIAEYYKTYNKKRRATQEYKDKNNQYRTERYWKNPLVKVRTKLTQAVRRIFNYKAGLKTMNIIGVSSAEEFISEMSSKTLNKNWISDNYNIDHIWQFHWFSDFMNKNISNDIEFQKVISIVHNHKNLRPLLEEENFKRNRMDFSPLLKEDFPIYEPYLNEDVKIEIKAYLCL